MGVVVSLILFSPIAAITGGVAGAIVGGGREDRPIWQNIVIGVVGWTVAWVVIDAVTGRTWEEMTFWHIGLALFASVLFVRLDEWWLRRSSRRQRGGNF